MSRRVSRGVRIRLMVFIIMSAVGITYITATYLGVVDRLTGRGLEVSARLPGSGGLFEGSEVTYRGVKVGKVTKMTPTTDGVELELKIEDGTQLPLDSRLYVHNLSAVGEQYLDFQPPDGDGPYAEDGTVFDGDASSLPVDEGDLLVDMNDFVGSVGKRDLRVVVKELGVMFGDTGRELQTMLDNGSRFIEVASAHTDETIALLQDGLTVLQTQRGQKENIRSFADDLATVTAAIRGSDTALRRVFKSAPGAAREIQGLLEDLEPTLPILLADAISVNQILVSHLAGTKQLLVTLPMMFANANAMPNDGWGHVNLQFDSSVPPCTAGYMPPKDWRSTQDLTDSPIYPARCTAGPPYVMRGVPHVPGHGANASPSRSYGATYDPGTGFVDGAFDARGNPIRFRQPTNLSVLEDDAWKWLLVGPVANP